MRTTGVLGAYRTVSLIIFRAGRAADVAAGVGVAAATGVAAGDGEGCGVSCARVVRTAKTTISRQSVVTMIFKALAVGLCVVPIAVRASPWSSSGSHQGVD